MTTPILGAVSIDVMDACTKLSIATGAGLAILLAMLPSALEKPTLLNAISGPISLLLLAFLAAFSVQVIGGLEKFVAPKTEKARLSGVRFASTFMGTSVLSAFAGIAWGILNYLDLVRAVAPKV